MQGTKNKTLNLLRHKKRQSVEQELPVIPDKRYFSIGEVGNLCLLKPHVLRYWEQEFSQLKPAKRRGNRRYYQYDDVLIIRTIRKLLYEDGFTIEGARVRLTQGSAQSNQTTEKKTSVKKMIDDLENVLQKLKAETT